MPESTLAAQPALACELATLSVVCLAWRLRSAIAESSSGRLVMASRCRYMFFYDSAASAVSPSFALLGRPMLT